MLAYYSSGPVDEHLLDELTRSLTESESTCDEWTSSAPESARQNLSASCTRIYRIDQLEELKRAANQTRKAFGSR